MFKIDLGEWLGEDVSPIVISMNFNNLDCAIKYLIAKMMKFDG